MTKHTQRDYFLESEGNGWYSRNRIEKARLEEKRAHDPLLPVLRRLESPPRRVLEIGASNGWRLALLREEWPGGTFHGVDPSSRAVEDAPGGVTLSCGTADSLPYEDASFDLVIFGFCLYLCDRADLFRIAAEADRVLADGGTMAIYDFSPPQPYRNPYAHGADIYSYKMDYSALFSWNPAYRIAERHEQTHPGGKADTPDNQVGIVLLKKDMAAGWPDNPYQENPRG